MRVTVLIWLRILYYEAVLIHILIRLGHASIYLLSWCLRSLWSRSRSILWTKSCRGVFRHTRIKYLFSPSVIVNKRTICKRLIISFFLCRRILFNSHWLGLNTWWYSSLPCLSTQKSLMLGMRREISIISLLLLLMMCLIVNMKVFKIGWHINGFIISNSVFGRYLLCEFSFFGFRVSVQFIRDILKIWKILERLARLILLCLLLILFHLMINHVFLLGIEICRLSSGIGLSLLHVASFG